VHSRCFPPSPRGKAGSDFLSCQAFHEPLRPTSPGISSSSHFFLFFVWRFKVLLLSCFPSLNEVTPGQFPRVGLGKHSAFRCHPFLVFAPRDRSFLQWQSFLPVVASFLRFFPILHFCLVPVYFFRFSRASLHRSIFPSVSSY